MKTPESTTIKTIELALDEDSNEDLAWLFRVLGADHSVENTSEFLCLPSHTAPQFSLPIANRSSASQALLRFHDNRTVTERVRTLAASSIAKAGLANIGPGDITKFPHLKLIEEIGRRLGESNLSAAITIGPQRRNRKPVLQLLSQTGRPVGFAKIGWSAMTTQLVRNESKMLRLIEGQLPPAFNAPIVLNEFPYQDTWVVVVSHISTNPFVRRRGQIDPKLIIEMAQIDPTSAAPMSKLPFLDEWRNSELASALDIGQLMANHAGKTLDLGLWHGDLTPWNTATSRRQMSIWDWEFANTNRPVGFDILHNQFELLRRSPKSGAKDAITFLEANCQNLLKPTGNPPNATLDLYFCELIWREFLLSGQIWQATNIEALTPVLLPVVERRLRSNS